MDVGGSAAPISQGQQAPVDRGQLDARRRRPSRFRISKNFIDPRGKLFALTLRLFDKTEKKKQTEPHQQLCSFIHLFSWSLLRCFLTFFGKLSWSDLIWRGTNRNQAMRSLARSGHLAKLSSREKKRLSKRGGQEPDGPKILCGDERMLFILSVVYINQFKPLWCQTLHVLLEQLPPWSSQPISCIPLIHSEVSAFLSP